MTTNTTLSLQDAFRLALGHHQAGRLPEAEQIYRQVLAVAPGHADSWHLLGVIAHQCGNQVEAIRLIREAIRLAPRAADFHANLGEAYRTIREFAPALAAFEEALRLNPQQLAARSNLAIALIDLHRYDEAVAQCKAVLAIQPQYANAHNNMGTALQHLGEYAAAADCYRRAIALLPELADLHCCLGSALLQTKDAQGALAAFEDAVALDATSASAREGYANTLLALGRDQEAWDWLAALPQSEFAQHPGLAVAKAKVLEARGDVLAAQTELRTCLRSHSGYLAARNALIDLLAKQARSGQQAPAEPPITLATEPPSVSIIICSITPSKFAAVSARYAALFAGLEHEIIGIHDAKSLAEGYNRGAGQSSGEVLIFSHDDIELLNDDFAVRLFRHLGHYDLVGVAGTRLLIEPAWRRAGYPHLAGLVAHRRPQDSDYHICVYGVHEVPAAGIEAVDGLWFAVRREVWETVRFDETVFDGFHLYDMDFSFAARLKGYRLTVAPDLLLVHHSYGEYSNDWEIYAERFRVKYAVELASRRSVEAPLDYLPTLSLPDITAFQRFAGLALNFLPTSHFQQSVNDYPLWLERYATLNAEELAEQRAAGAALAHQPLISVLMPVYNPPERWLRRAIDTVLAQSYENWELCIADDASPAPHVRQVLEEYAARDSRIHVAFREKNGHISAASNTALNLAQGEWLALFDHDDELSPEALYWLACEVNRHPDAGIIYSDEDKIDEDGLRSDPYFKSDWNYDLFLSHNLISHLGAYRTALVRELGGFRLGLEGSQDYDLALRCIEKLQPAQIRHIPRALYHWRTLAESTASGNEAKPYAFLAGQRALHDHLQRMALTASVEVSPYHASHNRLRYSLPAAPPLVSILIPTRNGLDILRQCLLSLAKTSYPRYELLIIDNGSDDPATLDYLATLAQRADCRVLRDPSPFNFSALNNRAVAAARGEVLCLLNNDIEVISPDWLEEMVSHALRPGVAAVGARLWYPDDTLQHGGVLLVGGVAAHAHRGLRPGQHGYSGRGALTQNLSAVTAACLVIRKALYLEVGGMDEQLAVAFNDVDFCLKLCQAGYRNVWTPFAELYHHESKTRGYEDSPDKRQRFLSEVTLMQQRWGKLLRNDPAYNLNLCLMRGDFALAWPPRHEADGA